MKLLMIIITALFSVTQARLHGFRFKGSSYQGFFLTVTDASALLIKDPFFNKIKNVYPN